MRLLPYGPGVQRVLVVDDDATVADVVGRYLVHAGFESRCGRTVRAAWSWR